MFFPAQELAGWTPSSALVHADAELDSIQVSV
jgi:hypothetical protein